jgi:plasmid maintenance system antidote protein VapI
MRRTEPYWGQTKDMRNINVDKSWIKEALAANGYSQRDLARAWEVSEASVSRFFAGVEQQDLSLGRALRLAQMLDMSIDELAARLGLKGKVQLPPPSVPVGRGAPQVGTITLNPGATPGEMRVLLHLDIPARVASEVVALLGGVGTGGSR